MAPTTARAMVTAALTAALPATWRVMPYARNIDPPQVVTAMVRMDEVVPSPGRAVGWRDYTAGLILVAPMTDPTGPADDQVDDALEQVLAALDTDEVLTWTRAARGVYGDQEQPSYEVTTTATIYVTRSET